LKLSMHLTASLLSASKRAACQRPTVACAHSVLLMSCRAAQARAAVDAAAADRSLLPIAGRLPVGFVMRVV
jgi:hypothetical protein